jgi:uncharacterized protein (TIGR02058 family)
MTNKRIIAELGAGAALHGGDYTKAAIRAVNDAIHHSSMSFIHSLGLDSKNMQVAVTIGVQDPGKVDADAVKAALPRGQATVTVVHGGLDVADPESGDLTVIASCAVEVRMDLGQA